MSLGFKLFGLEEGEQLQKPRAVGAKHVWVIATSAGQALAELTTATGRQLTFRRNGVPEATFALSHEDEDAKLLLDALAAGGVPLLKVFRNGILRFHGYLAPFTEEAQEQSILTATFRGPFGRLLGDGGNRGRFTAAVKEFSQIDAGQIAWTLINETPSVGIRKGTIEATKLRDRRYESGNVGELIVNLTNVLDGFDFEVVPTDAGRDIGRFDVFARQGQERMDAPFEYGATTLANVRRFERATQPPINVARVIGADGLVGEKRNQTSIDKYGEWWVQFAASDVSEQPTLDDKAQALLRPNPIKVLNFTPDPALAPLPWDDYWLGDTVPVRARQGSLSEDSAARVNEITVVVDDNGNEAVEIPDPLSPGEEATLRAGLSVEVVE